MIVESPSKCDTIQKILQEYAQENSLPYDFRVTSCRGHIRNLPKKSTRSRKDPPPVGFPYHIAGIDLENGYKPTYEILPGRASLVRDLQRMAKEADKVLLATDPDREGEAMAWHLQQVLKLDEFERLVFTEITPKAIREALEQASDELNINLVHAQETRRILDRLAGFTVSPLLWKKISPGLSAGRVQSVGLALAVQRERERLVFQSTPYWTVHANVTASVEAQLYSVNDRVVATSGADFESQGQVLKDQSKLHLLEDAAADLVEKLQDADWVVSQVKSTRRQLSPPQPFTTSTLQQEANQRFGWSASETMRTAQQLYEQGLISYMRTDSTVLSDDAENVIGKSIRATYGADQWSAGPSGKYKKSAKFAQEAHEGIRPAIQKDGHFINPDEVALSPSAKSLYRLIYQRTFAARMVACVTNQTSVTIEASSGDTKAAFRVSGSVIVDPGFRRAYGSLGDNERELPPLREGEKLSVAGVSSSGHESQPPPRYSEASFVKELEALGVGRPSTYAGIVQILRDRAYVGNPQSRGKQTRASGSALVAQRAAGGEDFTGNGRGPLVPSLSAFVVCSLLEQHCPSYVDPGFTSTMEARLDQIAAGEDSGEDRRIEYLNEFYAGDRGLAATIKRIDDGVESDDARRVRLPALHDEQDGGVGLFVGPYGPYLQRSAGDDSGNPSTSVSLPPWMSANVSSITSEAIRSVLDGKAAGGILVTNHPDDHRPIRVKTGRFGPYLQWGEDGQESTSTHSIPRDVGIRLQSDEGFSLDPNDAVGYVGLPRTVCELNGTAIKAGLGPYGPYLLYNSSYASLKESDGDILAVDPETAKRVVLDEIVNRDGRRLARGVLKELGTKDGGMVSLRMGRFGQYLKWKKINAKIPQAHGDNPQDITLDEAWECILEKKGSGGSLEGKGAAKKRLDTADGVPPPPKRPPSSYLLFCSEKRPTVAQPGKALGDVAKELASIWAQTDEDDRAPYEKKAAEAKERYSEAKATWDAQYGKARTTSISKRKRSPSAYHYFCAEMRPVVAAECVSLGETSKRLARMWADTKDRTKFEEMASVGRLRNESEKLPSEGLSGRAHKMKRAPSAYMLFCQDMRGSIVNADGTKPPLGQATKRLAALWKDSDDSTRQKYEALAHSQRDRSS